MTKTPIDVTWVCSDDIIIDVQFALCCMFYMYYERSSLLLNHFSHPKDHTLPPCGFCWLVDDD